MLAKIQASVRRFSTLNGQIHWRFVSQNFFEGDLTPGHVSVFLVD